jgi:hypothetical protein
MDIEIDRDHLLPGERLSGTVTIGKPGLQEVTVGLLFREDALGGEATVSQVLAGGLEGARDLAEGATLAFELEVPEDAFPSVRTRHGGLFWEVVAVTDRVGYDTTASRRVEVAARPR